MNEWNSLRKHKNRERVWGRVRRKKHGKNRTYYVSYNLYSSSMPIERVSSSIQVEYKLRLVTNITNSKAYVLRRLHWCFYGHHLHTHTRAHAHARTLHVRDFGFCGHSNIIHSIHLFFDGSFTLSAHKLCVISNSLSTEKKRKEKKKHDRNKSRMKKKKKKLARHIFRCIVKRMV